MKSVKLSKHSADRAEARSKRYIVWDAELPGFGLRVMPSGARSWVVKYLIEGGVFA